METPSDEQSAPLSGERVPPESDQPLLVRLAHRLEGEERLDTAVARLQPIAARLLGSPARGLLLGRPLGHAAHPLLTDVPLGAWMSATLLDLATGPSTRGAARTLTGFGVLGAVPTAATGLAEWAHTEGPEARVGIVHAAGNVAALTLFSASYLARRRERHATGVLAGLAAIAVVSASGFLGAHMAIARNVGSRDATFADSLTSRPAHAGGSDGGLT